jgi:hypothetical protein
VRTHGLKSFILLAWNFQQIKLLIITVEVSFTNVCFERVRPHSANWSVLEADHPLELYSSAPFRSHQQKREAEHSAP